MAKRPPKLDTTQLQNLKAFCKSERQTEILEALIVCGGSYKKAGKQIGVNPSQISRAVYRIDRNSSEQAGTELHANKSTSATSETVDGDILQVSSAGSDMKQVDLYSKRIITLDDAICKAGVDLNVWEVERFIINSWEVGAKGPDKKIRVTPLWQVKVWLKTKKGWSAAEFRSILIDDMVRQAPSYIHVPKHSGRKVPLLGELSIFDAHFGKLAWSPETGQDYDAKICRKRYLAAGRDLICRMLDARIERMLYVVGNDFFHADHKSGTTGGTPMDCDGRWQKSFRYGQECCITLAEEAANHCPVDIMIVQGNHDREKVFCLGEVLAARFHNHPHIRVVNDPDVYSYYSWGKVLLGFVHGENHASKAKRAELPIQMSTDRPHDWANSVWREMHLGHFHSEQEDVWKYRKVEHVRDVAIRVLPSLSSTDAWHRESGYASVLSAEAFLYHKDKGRYAILSHCSEG